MEPTIPEIESIEGFFYFESQLVASLRRWTLDPASRGSIPVSALSVGFSALPTRKSSLTGNEHSRSRGCPYTRKKAAPLGVTCQQVKRQKKLVASCSHPSWMVAAFHATNVFKHMWYSYR